MISVTNAGLNYGYGTIFLSKPHSRDNISKFSFVPNLIYKEVIKTF